jgi:hypothetical protein
MAIEKLASVNVETAREEPPLLELKIQCRSMEAYKTLVNMLGVIQWNGGVGHSAVTAAFFDGDGADQVKIDGLPEGPYKEMAQALSSNGDGFMGMVDAERATAYNTISDYFRYEGTTVKAKIVYPPQDVGSEEADGT